MRHYSTATAVSVLCRGATATALVLPDGEMHDDLCQRCGASLGEKRESRIRHQELVLPAGFAAAREACG